VIAKYSKLEQVDRTGQLQHPIVREAFRITGIHERIEVASMSDIPAGTGLGSSGSFTTALLKALHTHNRHFISPRDLAEQACHIECPITAGMTVTSKICRGKVGKSEFALPPDASGVEIASARERSLPNACQRSHGRVRGSRPA
jgi:pantoate kinase